MDTLQVTRAGVLRICGWATGEIGKHPLFSDKGNKVYNLILSATFKDPAPKTTVLRRTWYLSPDHQTKTPRV
jgi:hypothetical protein